MPKRKIRADRTEFVAFYVTQEEKSAIVRMAQALDMSISDFCRKTLLANVRVFEKND